MTSRQALAGMLQVFAVFLFFGAGLFFTCLPFRPELRIQLADALTQNPDQCTWVGLAFFGLTALFAFGFYAATRGRYLLLNLGNNLVRIDSKVLHRTIGSLLEKHFSRAILLNDVGIVRGRHLELRVQMLSMEAEEQEKILGEAENHLAKLLSQRFGYHTPFTLQVLKP